MATTAFCYSAKQELLQAIHNFNGVTTQTASGVSGAFTLTGMASTANISVGQGAAATNVATGAVVASIDSISQVTLSKAHTGTITTATITFTADAFFIALVKSGPAHTFDGTQTNIGTPGTSAASTSNLGTDEVTGTGYTSGGQALTNVTPSLSSTTGITTFGANPSWTGATFSTTAGIIYNNTVRGGAAATPMNGRTLGVFDFGGTQTIAAGTFTLILPTANSSNAILRIA